MSRNAVTIAGLLLFALCLACAAQSPVQFGFGSGELSPVKFGGKKLPSWLTSDYAPIFNGINNYASCAALITGDASNRSFMTWIKVHRYTASNQIITQGSVPGFVFYMSSSSTYVVRFGLGTEYTTTANNALQVGVWQHVAWTKTGTTGRLYIDGVLNTSFGLATTAATIPTTQTYMGSQNTTSQYSNVSLAELSVWNRALTQSEILRYKDKRLKGTESGLVALYHMNDNSQTLVDSVGGKNAIASNSINWTRRDGYVNSPNDIRNATNNRYALSFDGVDDVANATSTGLPTGSNARTVMGWFFDGEPANTAGKSEIVWGPNLANQVFKVGLYGQTIGLAIGGPVRRIPLKVPRSYRWYHLAVSGPSGGTLGSYSAYVDGVLQLGSDTYESGGTANSSVNTQLATFSVCGWYVSAGYSPKKKACEISIWNRELSQAEIQANMYQQMTGSETGLVYYYRGNEGTGTTLTNLGSAGSAGNLTLYNSPTWVGRDMP